MKVTLKIVLSVLLMCLVAQQATSKPWRGIVPLHSMKADVERLLGKPTTQDRFGMHYDLENEKVEFALTWQDSVDDCGKRLGPDIVIRIAVTPKQQLQMSDLKLQGASFQPFEPFQLLLPNLGAYVDNTDGIIVRTNEGKIDRIVYMAQRKDQELCSGYYQDPVLMASRILCVLCPQVVSACPDTVEAGTILTFTSNVASGNNPTYKWMVNEGKIIGGQGTTSITVDTNKLEGKTVTATLEVGGIDPACSNKTSCSTPVVPRSKN